MTTTLLHEPLSQAIIGAGIEVHRALGPGLLESAYEICLCHELSLRNIPFQQQLPISLECKGIRLDCGYRLDLLVDDTVIVEVKAVERIIAIHEAQLLTYLRLLRKRIGLVMNFHAPVLKDGILRRVL